MAADSFQIDWKKRGEIGKSTISIREKNANFMALLLSNVSDIILASQQF